MMAAKRPKKIRATWDFRDPKSDRKLGPHGFQKSEKCQLTQPRFGPPLKYYTRVERIRWNFSEIFPKFFRFFSDFFPDLNFFRNFSEIFPKFFRILNFSEIFPEMKNFRIFSEIFPVGKISDGDHTLMDWWLTSAGHVYNQYTQPLHVQKGL